MQRHLYLDIETIPAQSPDARDLIAETIKPPANYKKAETIAEWEKNEKPAAVEDAWRKTSFDGALGQLAVIGAALDDGDPVTFWSDDWHDVYYEPTILRLFGEWLTSELPLNEELSTIIIGHYVSDFDLRFLRHRSIINGIRPHRVIARACDAKPWETDKVYDTMVQWSGVKGSIKLDKLCRALGIPGKGDMDGSKVWNAVQEGRIADVAAYCADDVNKVRAVHRRMTFAALRGALEDA